jgi:hypothetical protein
MRNAPAPKSAIMKGVNVVAPVPKTPKKTNIRANAWPHHDRAAVHTAREDG